MTIAIKNGANFHITFANGYTISVAFGRGNYCENYDKGSFIKTEPTECNDAEIAMWDKNGEWIRHPSYSSDDVIPHMSSDEILIVMTWLASQPKGQS